MKQFTSSTYRTLLLAIQTSYRNRRFPLIIFALLFSSIFWTSCNSSDGGSDESLVEGSSDIESNSGQVHLTFSGGGWRAHTVHSSLTLSLLANGNRKLDDIFKNVGTIGSNSGGSWYSTMLMFSDKFVEAIEADDAVNTWATTGWLGQQEQIFNQALCYKYQHWWEFLPCLIENLGIGGAEKAFHWEEIIENIVFKDYPLSQNITMSSPHLSWATKKNLLLASTLLTDEVVLNQEGNITFDKRFYQACLSPSTPQLNGNEGASCSEGDLHQVSPVTFSSLANSSYKKLPFFPAAANGGEFNIGYTENAYFDPTKNQTTISNPISNANVPVVLAASASSAAAGFLASKAVASDLPLPFDWEKSYVLEDEALSFQLSGGEAKFNADLKGMSIDDLKANKVVRLADGGPVDNSGVAQVVSFLQLNNQAEGFNIVAFDDVEGPFNPSGGGAAVGGNIANLFGENLTDGDKFCVSMGSDKGCINVPKLQIFDKAALNSTPVTWQVFQDKGNPDKQIIYTKYEVTTVDNSTFGVSANTKGTLHAFSCVWKDASTAPTTASAFGAYKDMLNFIHTSLNANEQEGLKHLEAALGISN